MTFDFEMIQKVYTDFNNRVDAARKFMGRPLTYSEKILCAHLHSSQEASAFKRGESYVDFAPDRVAMQDATAQMALLQFMQAGKKKVAVPSTVHADHLIQARVGATKDLQEANNKNNEVYASFAIAQKEPTRNDYEDYGSAQPKSERMSDWELGYNYKSRYFNAGINLYYMKYKNQFVLTGSQDSNGEMIAMNVDDSYRAGIELMAEAKLFKGFTWNANATLSRNKAHNMNLKLVDPTTWEESYLNVGTTNLSYSPSCIISNSFRYEYKGLAASLRSQYVSEQYMTNSGCRYYIDADGSHVSTMIDAYFVSDLDFSYTFKIPTFKSITVGCTIYNIFNEEYESNGACGLQFRSNGKGGVEAYQDSYYDSYSTYSCQAPIHFLAHLSLNF